MVIKVVNDIADYPLVKGITNHFMMRVSDWALALILFNFGIVLLSNRNIFDNPDYAGMYRVATKALWGTLCITVGIIRIAALTINGTYPSFRWSPHIRTVAAFMSCFAWLNICIGFYVAPTPTAALAVYPYLLLLDIYNTFLAASEAGKVERRRGANGGRRDNISSGPAPLGASRG